MVDINSQTPNQGQQPQQPVVSLPEKPVVQAPPPVGVNPIQPPAPALPSTDGQTVSSVLPPKKPLSFVFVLLGLLIVAAAAGGGYYLYSTDSLPFLSKQEPAVVLPPPNPIEFEKVSESVELSTDDSEIVIERELNETVIEDFDKDFEEIQEDVGEL